MPQRDLIRMNDVEPQGEKRDELQLFRPFIMFCARILERTMQNKKALTIDL
jgi:hypothetical protein